MINFKKRKDILIAISVLAVFVFGYLFLGGEKEVSYESIIAEKTNVIQEVSVTGIIDPIESVDLAFEVGGKVKNIYVKVGDSVKFGQRLVSLDSKELKTQLAKAEAGVDSQKARLEQYKSSLSVEQTKLEELERGTRKEEIKIAETKVVNAQKTLADAQINLDNTKQKANIDIANLYSDVNDILNDAYINADDAINKQITNLFSELSPNDFKLTFNITDMSQKTIVEFQRLEAKNELALLKSEIENLNDNSDFDAALLLAKDHLKILRNFLSELGSAVDLSVGLSSATVSTYRGYVNTGWTNVSTEIADINNHIQSISVQKITNQNTSFTAQSKVNDAQNAIASAQDELALKKAGATDEQIKVQEYRVVQVEANLGQQQALIKQAEANVKNYKAQIEKTIIFSPINGVVTKQDAKVGEIISLNIPVVSIINESAFEIDVNIPEADITKIKLNDTAKVTLDAYGDDILFKAKVFSIDPAETIIEGVATYKVVLMFKEGNEKIKSGMTANVDILTGEKKGVIAIPRRSVTSKNGKKIVRFIKDNKIIFRDVETGLKGSGGMIEIIKGIEEGDEVVTLVK